MRRAVVAIGGLVLLAGLGGAAAPAIGSTGAAGPNGTTGPTVTAGWAEDQHTITLRPGQMLRISLPGQSCTATSPPASAAPPVLRVREVGGSGGLSWALLQAGSAGTTVVTASHRDACSLGSSDFVPEQFSLTVRVR